MGNGAQSVIKITSDLVLTIFLSIPPPVSAERLKKIFKTPVYMKVQSTAQECLDCEARHFSFSFRNAHSVWALGLLMRTFQTGRRGRSLRECDVKAVLAAYCANVRSILEFAGVVWEGAAETHMKRVERVQHRFLMWLSGRCRDTDVSFEYDALLKRSDMTSLSARREQHDIVFIRNVHCHAVDSSFLLERFPLAVPARPLRNRVLFHVPHARVNTIKNGAFCRLPKLCNMFLDRNRTIDVWCHSALCFKRHCDNLCARQIGRQMCDVRFCF